MRVMKIARKRYRKRRNTSKKVYIAPKYQTPNQKRKNRGNYFAKIFLTKGQKRAKRIR